MSISLHLVWDESVHEWYPPKNVNLEESKPFTWEKLQISIPEHTRATQREASNVKFNYQTSVQLLPGRPINFPPFLHVEALHKAAIKGFRRQSLFSLCGKSNDQETDLILLLLWEGLPGTKSSLQPRDEGSLLSLCQTGFLCLPGEWKPWQDSFFHICEDLLWPDAWGNHREQSPCKLMVQQQQNKG